MQPLEGQDPRTYFAYAPVGFFYLRFCLRRCLFAGLRKNYSAIFTKFGAKLAHGHESNHLILQASGPQIDQIKGIRL